MYLDHGDRYTVYQFVKTHPPVHFKWVCFILGKPPLGKVHIKEFLLWLRGLKTRYSVRVDVGSIPGPAQWVKDLAWLQAGASVSDLAGIWHCCGRGCGVGRQLQR